MAHSKESSLHEVKETYERIQRTHPDLIADLRKVIREYAEKKQEEEVPEINSSRDGHKILKSWKHKK